MEKTPTKIGKKQKYLPGDTFGHPIPIIIEYVKGMFFHGFVWWGDVFVSEFIYKITNLLAVRHNGKV